MSFEFDQISISEGSKATLVSICCPKMEHHRNEKESQESLDELRALLTTLGLKPSNQYIQNRKNIEAATVLGMGKLVEIAELAKNDSSDVLVFDFDLSPGQVRNIQELTQMKVLDRCAVILDIFAKHARTKEAKIQIEISRLEYILPRLSSMWAHLGRQKGGIGVRGGEGEQQIELDRRIIRKRIETYKKQLKEIEVSRREQKKKRENKAVTAALVGYTNAGKSSLMNRLCKVNVLEENKLFATLDSTFRTLNPDTRPPIILIDTVGFISNLPASLVNGFKTTLDSAIEADLLIIVVDLSNPQYEKHLEVTYAVLDQLKLGDKDRVIVFNKKDQIQGPFTVSLARKKHTNSFVISTLDEQDIKEVRSYIINYFLDQQSFYDLFIPYERGDLHSLIKAKTNIFNTGTHEKGIFYRIKVPGNIFGSLNIGQYILAKNDPKAQQWEKILEDS